jgi:hypothetical protein
VNLFRLLRLRLLLQLLLLELMFLVCRTCWRWRVGLLPNLSQQSGSQLIVRLHLNQQLSLLPRRKIVRLPLRSCRRRCIVQLPNAQLMRRWIVRQPLRHQLIARQFLRSRDHLSRRWIVRHPLRLQLSRRWIARQPLRLNGQLKRRSIVR